MRAVGIHRFAWRRVRSQVIRVRCLRRLSRLVPAPDDLFSETEWDDLLTSTGNPCTPRLRRRRTPPGPMNRTGVSSRTGPRAISSRRCRRNPTGTISSPLSAQSIALIIKRRTRAAGLDPRDFAGHSLRSGFSTQAASDGYLPAQIADVTRHQDRRTLDGYIQAGHGAKHLARVL